MIKAFFKSLTGDKQLLRASWRLFCTAVGCISSIYAFSTLLKEVGITEKLEPWVKEHIWLIIIIGTVIALFIQREKLTRIHKVECSDLQIEICVRDIFLIEADSYVIPTNTFFRTKMDGEYISPRSVQGRFQKKYFKDNNSALDKLIDESLKEQEIIGVDSKDRFGNVKQYPIGTVAKIDHKGKHFYFVAISDINEYGKPIAQEMRNIDNALDGLLSAVKSFGHCDILCTPLIGTGRAAIKEATIERVFQRTVDKFIENEGKISKKLIICINPNDYTEDRAHISKLEKYLEYHCEFSE